MCPESTFLHGEIKIFFRRMEDTAIRLVFVFAWWLPHPSVWNISNLKTKTQPAPNSNHESFSTLCRKPHTSLVGKVTGRLKFFSNLFQGMCMRYIWNINLLIFRLAPKIFRHACRDTPKIWKNLNMKYPWSPRLQIWNVQFYKKSSLLPYRLGIWKQIWTQTNRVPGL